MIGARDLDAVIASIYEASLDAGGLDNLAGIVARALGSESGFIALLERPQPGQVALPSVVGLPSATANFDKDARGAYAEHYHQHNIWFATGVKRGFPAIVLGDELVQERELLRSEWYEYCKRLEAFHVLGAQFHITDQLSGQFGAHLPRRCRSFDEVSRQTMSLILPHLQRALQIHVRLGLAEEIRTLSLDLLERLGLAFIVIDGNQRVLHCNALAERKLAGSSPLRMRSRCLHVSGDSAAAFKRVVQDAARTSEGRCRGSGGVVQMSLNGGRKLRLFVGPLPASRCPFDTARPAVLVLVADPAGGSVHVGEVLMSVEGLREAFGLTAAEAKLLAALASGESVSTYAQRSGVALETARTHAKRVLSKSGYHRQIDLVRAVASDPMFRFN